MKFLLILLFALPALAQSELPTFGDLSEIKGKAKFYAIAADSGDRRQIENVLSEQLTKVPVAEEAELFVEYKSLGRTVQFLGGTERGELSLYYLRDGKKIVVWSDAVTGGAHKSDTARRLARKLRSALKKSSK